MGGTPLVVGQLPGLKYEAAGEGFTLWLRFISSDLLPASNRYKQTRGEK